ncbi:DNA adenine methylase [Campylobacter canadensis]|uniref:DNA adenine methylase n=1 Tax=Campylobacter canadensis TaxID=449520 RepID=UPI001552C175|nr:DNA adenine methylase [Campylobacter canadensis]MBZ7994979.1 DNA adenine methylase [Campylobacter canadensis]MBZ7996871.1 DNA adenine methylase [Campylobacter canadensis]MBZ8000350.1 DNA adenine methylase [Campylobacter canadensis]MBZ8002151.1 DNA adenine methylase [Campylobacter canadensis]
MNYIGSKLKLSSFIFSEVKSVVNTDLKDFVFCDLFSGTSIVARTFKPYVKQIISNDMEFYSFVLAKNYIENNIDEYIANLLINELNQAILEKKLNGFIYYNYSEFANRQYFTNENAIKIDTARITIEEWFENSYINDKEYYFLLTSLLESADKLANTASVYGAFLKKIKKSALKDLVIEKAEFLPTNQNNLVFNKNANELIKTIKGDVLYLDPPYNSREYGANYHLLNTIAKYDEFIPKGKTGLRDYTRSNWCKKAKVYDELEELVKNANFKYIFLSYNDEGLLSFNDIKNIFSKYGKYSYVSKDYQRFKADNDRVQKQGKTIEYLHILIK